MNTTTTTATPTTPSTPEEHHAKLAKDAAAAAEIVITVKPTELEYVMHEAHQKKAAYLTARAHAAPALEVLLRQVMNSLPRNLDWLDPDVERQSKALLKELEGLNPDVAALNV